MEPDRITNIILMVLMSRKDNGSPWTFHELQAKLDLLLGSGTAEGVEVLRGLLFKLCAGGEVNMVDGNLHVSPKGEQRMRDGQLYDFFKRFFEQQASSA